MAELDLKGFITPREQPNLLFKLGEELDAQKKAKAEAAKEAKAQKAATGAAIESYFDPKLYDTGTIEDAVVTKELYKLKDKAYQLGAVPGMDINTIKMAISPDMNKLTQSVQNIKFIDAQRKLGLDQIKNIKGVDADKYNREFLSSTFLNPDGTVREDIYALDPAKDYHSNVMQGNIYNLDTAIADDIKNMGKNTEMTDVLRRDTKGNIYGAKTKIQTASGFVPKYEKDTKGQDVFVGVEPKGTTMTPQTDEEKRISKAITGNENTPIKLVTDDDFVRMKSIPGVMGGINQATREYAQSIGRTPTNEEILAFQKAKLFEAYDRSAKTGFAHEDVEKKEAPVIKNYMSMGGGAKEPTINELYDRMFATVNSKLEEYKADPKKWGNKNYVQVNVLDTDMRNAVLKEARNALGDQTIGVGDIKLKLDEKGMMGIYDKGNKLKAQITPQGTNIPVTPKAGGKEKEVKRIPPISSYGKPIQAAIAKFMAANKLSEQDAIRILIENGKIPK